MKKISIIMPLYNTKEYIGAAIKSVLSQCHANLELIVIDDGSTDGGFELVSEMCEQDPRLKLIRNQRSKGVSGARNTGIENSTGEYIAFLDSDDLYTDNSLSERYKYLEEHQNLNIVCSDFNLIDGDSKVTLEQWFGNSTNCGSLEENCCSIIKEPLVFFLEQHCLCWMGTVMVRKTHLHSVGMFREDMTHSEDEELWYRLCNNTNLAFIKKTLASYRKREGSATQDNQKRLLGAITHKLIMLKSDEFSDYKLLIRKNLLKKYTAYIYFQRETHMFKECLIYSLKMLIFFPTEPIVYKFIVAALIRRP